MNLVEFLQDISLKGVKLWCDGEKLRTGGSQEVLTPDVIAQLKQHKTEILQLLHEQPDILQVYPLSYGQTGLRFLWELAPQSYTYNLSFALRIYSQVDLAILQQTFEVLRTRHPMLRSTFPKLGQELVQQVHQNQSLDFLEIDASSWSEDELQAKVVEAHRHPFDLETQPVMRIRWFSHSERDHILLLTIHHIAWDGWSMSSILKELPEIYQAQQAGVERSLPQIDCCYQDYVSWQRKLLAGSEGERLWGYWQQKLAGELPVLNLLTDRPRPPIQTYNGAAYPFKLSQKLTKQLKELAQEEEATLYMVLLAAFQILLSRYTGQEDILVGSPTYGRSRPEFVPIVGYFVDQVVIRGNLSGNPCFKDFLLQGRQTVIGALAHQDYPFSLLVQRLQLEQDSSRSPLFQAYFILQNFQGAQNVQKLLSSRKKTVVNWAGWEVEPLALAQYESLFDLTLEMSEEDSSMLGLLKYNTDLFDEQTIAKMANHFENLLAGIVSNPEQRVVELPLLSEAERQQILVEWNNTKKDYPAEKCIYELFETQVEQTPEAIAVVFEEQQLTYSQLNSRANQLAHYLQGLGVKPETLVGICVERSVEMVVGLLAILKAGGAYVALDPNYPTARLAQILEDGELHLVLTDSNSQFHLPETKTPVLDINKANTVEKQTNVVSNVNPQNLAYVLYTSGSTGRPKGVAIEHRSPVSLLHWAREVYSQEELSGVLASTSICFDLSVFELFVPLSWGGKVILAENALHLPELPAAAEVSLINTVPSAARELIRSQSIPSGVKTVNLAGEPLENQLVQQLYGQATIKAVYNLYGPSEDTTYSTYGLMEKGGRDAPTIGRPISNTLVYILDSNFQPVPIGVPGEMYIAGEGLARGYLKQAELTAEKFIFWNGKRLYKTGDLARYQRNGQIQFLGRLDHQVKIRGYRIETGEIQAILNEHPQVKETVVLAREDKFGTKGLVAYIVVESETPEVSETEQIYKLKQYLKERLPEYMIPSRFVLLPQLPLTPNGKVDRKALPVPEMVSSVSTEYVAPETEAEKVLTEIWKEVLGIEKVGIYDNFFKVGGDSIITIQIVTRAQKAGIQLTTKQLLQNQTIAEQAAVAGAMASVQHQQGLVTGEIPLTPIQHWFFEQNLQQMYHFNQSLLLSVSPQIKPDLLSKVVEKILEHHDALRLRYHKTSNYWQQINSGVSESIPFHVVDLSKLSETEQLTLLEQTATAQQASLNLTNGPIMRVVLFNLGSQVEGRLLIIIHHLAVDGVCWRILLEDLFEAYNQLSKGESIKLPEKTTAFQDWAVRLVEYGQSQKLQQELDYWLNQPWSGIVSLPIDYPEGKANNTVGNAVNVTQTLSQEQTTALLQEVPSAYNTQINDVLLTGLVVSLGEWMGTETVLIDLEGHGREELFADVDLSRTVGWFTSMFPVKLQLSSEEIGEVLKSVKEQLRKIPDRGIGYGILRYLNQDEQIRTQLAALPPAEVSFNYLGQFKSSQSQQVNWQRAWESVGANHSPQINRTHLLDINALIVEGQLQIIWTYNSCIHKDTTIVNLAENYIETVQNIISHCQSLEVGGYTPSDFSMVNLSQEKLDRLIAKFN
ncbi:MAG: amino acid adenylation domain-containing protein [Moorea sp. SIOASIH]|uniref:VatQ n=1 Tax=Moorena producens ASI16Jul14-2 TaxID=2546228 RepID=A0A4P8JBP7_9CYAN|nr:non-ribosomal peptide synthetase [Moorena sp. SIOASIH]NEO38505.1 amino acid adenylation domain-containing protein [Moorena sp. SIOASIH]QCP68976.1 VatQ [Moorena producens ASI16Jul14-2]